MTVTDRADATPPEVVEARVVEEVARAIDEARDAHGPFYFPCKCGWEAGFGAGWEDRGDQHRLLSIAAAAVAAYRAAQDGGAEEAVRRVEAVLAEAEDRNARYSNPLFGGFRFSVSVATSEIRAALAPQAGDGAR